MTVDITECMVKERVTAKFEDVDKVEVKRVYKEDGGKTRWWFWLKGDATENVLSQLDSVVMDKYRQLQKKSPILL